MERMLGFIIGSTIGAWYLFFRKKEHMSDIKKISYSLLIGVLFIGFSYSTGIIYEILYPTTSISSNAQINKTKTSRSKSIIEFTSGKKKVFRSKGHLKAMGIDLSIEYPESWFASEGEQPHLLQNISSEGGKGFESCIITITKPFLGGIKLSNKDIYNALNPNDLKDTLPEGTVFIKGERTKIEGLDATWMIYTTKTERAGFKFNIYFLMYTFYHDLKLIQLQFMVGEIDTGKKGEIRKRFDENKTLFVSMANSITFHN